VLKGKKTLIEKEIRKTIPFTIASKKLKVNLTKEVRGFYNKNYKTLKKEIEEDIRRWKDLPVHGFAELIW
jgi:hypothetical protein